MREREEIARLVRDLNETWLGGRCGELDAFFCEEVVLAPPGFGERVHGRAALVASYREFGEAATIHAFEPEEPRVDLVDGIAVATTAFTIDYEIEGRRARETGTDLLVLRQGAKGWRIAWRTVVARAAEVRS